MDATVYVKYHSLQTRDGSKFIKQCAEVLKWTDLSKDIVMDLGCGPGTSCETLLDLFPDIFKIIAIDTSDSMIEWARKRSPDLKIDYSVVDILDKQKLEKWEGCVSKLISIYCLHWVADQEKALCNIFNLLKTEGETGILTVIKPCHFEAAKEMFSTEKWKQFSEGMDFSWKDTKHLSSSDFTEMLTRIGFKVIMCKEENENFTFETDNDCIGFLGSVYPLENKVPPHLKEEMEKDYLKYFVKHNGMNFDTQPVACYKVLKIIAKKPML